MYQQLDERRNESGSHHDPIAEILPILHKQNGCITSAQALDHLSYKQWLHLIESPVFKRVHANVYAWIEMPFNWLHKVWAAVLSIEGAAVSHASAARLWGISIYDTDETPVTITTETSDMQPRTVVRIASSYLFSQAGFTRRHSSGLLLTSPEQTLVDLGNVASVKQVGRTLDSMCFSGLTTLEKTINYAELMRPHRVRGMAALRRVLDIRTSDSRKTESQMERNMLRRMRSENMPEAETQVWISTHDGNYRMDIAFPGQQINVEIDGPHHLSPEHIVNDRKRDTAISANGWLVMRFGIYDDEDEFIGRLHHHLRY